MRNRCAGICHLGAAAFTYTEFPWVTPAPRESCNIIRLISPNRTYGTLVVVSNFCAISAE